MPQLQTDLYWTVLLSNDFLTCWSDTASLMFKQTIYVEIGILSCNAKWFWACTLFRANIDFIIMVEIRQSQKSFCMLLLISCLAHSLTLRWKRYVPPKRRKFSELHGVITHKSTALITLNPPSVCNIIHLSVCLGRSWVPRYLCFKSLGVY
jgi:glucose-6-phosphate-specific signal transduction histidine kinase